MGFLVKQMLIGLGRLAGQRVSGICLSIPSARRQKHTAVSDLYGSSGNVNSGLRVCGSGLLQQSPLQAPATTLFLCG